MSRTMLCALLVCGCFNESDPVDPTQTIAATMTGDTEESSSSSRSAGESSSDGESSSTGGPIDPMECPKWCNNGCDLAGGIFAECRCALDQECAPGGLECDRPSEELGHCR